ncbi:MAG: gamma-glutamyl-gamma-aminobutyrate hydrolase family protein, partial [Clostridiales bacterium]|nr:gamma-glutamyl-gamma-aminobutyrate hydrolase family protein [Clostridiales bacterium]
SDEIDKGGTLRLGAYPCEIAPGTTMERCYGTRSISERHRHRYEFNNDYREILQKNALTLSGMSPDGRLVETVELTGRDFFVGVQYHPEFKSRPNRPHPLFLGFVGAAVGNADRKAE